MPVFRLSDAVIFPSPQYAEPDGLLAVGGDLSRDRLLLAYRMGIFPWYAEGTPILWWSPDPRLVLFPNELRVSKSLRRVIKKGLFRVSFNTRFRQVMTECANVRREQGEDTWIVPEMLDAYTQLHESGYAHSVEVWHNAELVGGLYGVALGHVFFGESMFTRKSNASKVALVCLVCHLKRWNYQLIDCQVTTPHLQRFGAREIPRSLFLHKLHHALHGVSSSPGTWEISESWPQWLPEPTRHAAAAT